MYSPELLAQVFDVVVANHCERHPLPNNESLQKINSQLKVRLPRGLIDLAKYSTNFGGWFASLGPNYEAPQHIIRINARLACKRHRRNGRWVYAKPRSLVIINLGFDGDFDCLDLDSFDEATGEYAIVYWTPGSGAVLLARNFLEYIARHLVSWSKNGPKRNAIASLLRVAGVG